MHTERFGDRLDPATYENDEEVVGIYEKHPDEPDARWISGRLFRRLTTIASAYELHTLPMLHSEAVRLNRTQAQSLLDEISFVADRVDDALIVGVAQTVADYVTIRLRRPAWVGDVTFDAD